MGRFRALTTFALLAACLLLGAAGGVMLATRAHGSASASGRVVSRVASAALHDPTTVAVGDGSVCIVTGVAGVDCWGVDPDGLLGVGVAAATGCQGYCTPRPRPVGGLRGVVSVASGDEFACALLAGGRVKCWGANNYGQLGAGESTGPQQCAVPAGAVPCSRQPLPVTGIRDAVSVAAGGADACAVIRTGQVDCWGSAVDGVLGDGNADGARTCGGGSAAAPCDTEPVPVFGIGDATAVAVGSLDACALMRGGRVACWGDNGAGQLGDGATTGPDRCAATTGSEPCSRVPVAVTGIAGATGVTVGAADACALLDAGQVDCWGDNSEGALGTGHASAPDSCPLRAGACAATPQRVALRAAAIMVSAGDEDVCALLGGGGVDCWGGAAGGALGVGESTATRNCVGSGQLADRLCVTAPTPVTGLRGATAIAAGTGTSCSLQAGGGVDCWGENQAAQLGTGGNGGPGSCVTQAGRLACATTPIEVQGLR